MGTTQAAPASWEFDLSCAPTTAGGLTRLAHAAVRLVFGRLLPRIAYPVLRGPLRGCRYLLGATSGEAGGVSVHLGAHEVKQLALVADLLRPGDVFFDVGANVGLYSLLASRLVQQTGRVVAFEPVPRNISFLQRHIHLNHAGNITILPLACADGAGVESFSPGPNFALGSFAPGGDTVPDETTTLVPTITLDDASARLRLRPHAIKIDIEGAELRALHGAVRLLREAAPVLLLSVHSSQLRDSCLEFLRQMEYSTQPLNSAASEFVAKPRCRASQVVLMPRAAASPENGRPKH